MICYGSNTDMGLDVEQMSLQLEDARGRLECASQLLLLEGGNDMFPALAVVSEVNAFLKVLGDELDQLRRRIRADADERRDRTKAEPRNGTQKRSQASARRE